MTQELDLIQQVGYVRTEPRSPLNKHVQLFSGFNPQMVATCLRDTLRFLFEQTGIEGLKYNKDPKDSNIAIDVEFEASPEGPFEKVPKVIISRGGYQTNPVGLNNSVVNDRQNPLSGQRDHSRYANLINGQIDITVKAWNLGTCERLAYYTNVFLTWSRPQLCDTLGFKNLGQVISVSSPQAVKDEKECFLIQLAVPYTTEMVWHEHEIGIKIKEFLAELQK